VPAPKLRIPAAAGSVVIRPRLCRLLDGDEPPTAADQPVTFLCAPAGAGKTTLLAEWARAVRRRAEATVAWVSLDPMDNDVSTLWSALLAALPGAPDPPGRAPANRVATSRRRTSSAFLAAFVEAVDRTPEPVVLVLDDLHEIHDRETLQSLDVLLRRPPAGLRILLAARFAPMVSLARLRLEGRLREIEGEHLGFTEPEAVALLRSQGVDLAADDLALLMQRTEGWAAGLRLAAMSLAGSPTPSTLIRDLASSERAVADYLVGEVLTRRPEPVRDFLLATSVCERVTADLAGRLSGREDAVAILDELVRSNAFVVRCGRRGSWYRFHPLLAEYLRAELARLQPQRLPELNRAAAMWFADHDPMTAVEHALSAADPDLTARLLEAHGARLLVEGQGGRLRRVLDSADVEVTVRPGVAVVAAAAALEAGDAVTAGAALARTRRARTPSPRLRALDAAIRLQRARLDGDVAQTTDLLAEPAVVSGDTDLDLLIRVKRGGALVWLADDVAAEAELRRTLATARNLGRDWVVLQCTTLLAVVACVRTELRAAARLSAEAIGIAADRGWTGTAPHAGAALVRGWVGYLQLDRDAEAAAGPVLQALTTSPEPAAALPAEVFGAIAAFDDTDDRRAVVGGLHRTWSSHRTDHVHPVLVACTALIEQRMAFQAGELTRAAEVVGRAGWHLDRAGAGPAAERAVLQAVRQAHRGRVDLARRALVPVLTGRLPAVSAITRVEAWIWEARLATRAGDHRRSFAAAVEAMRIAEPERLLRPFVGAGREFRGLVAANAGRFGSLEAFAGEVLAAVAPVAQDGMAGLTTREMELLDQLPSLLTAEEIAASLYVSVNTVKTHLRGIYRKLGVNSRRDAILLARRHGLLGPAGPATSVRETPHLDHGQAHRLEPGQQGVEMLLVPHRTEEEVAGERRDLAGGELGERAAGRR
jgi:LuxR family maltose regulon positive regulatory protein